MRDFQKFIEKNRREMYAVAYSNCKHDEKGHCIFPEDNDPWMDIERKTLEFGGV